jgi:hypothetical protein
VAGDTSATIQIQGSLIRCLKDLVTKQQVVIADQAAAAAAAAAGAGMAYDSSSDHRTADAAVQVPAVLPDEEGAPPTEEMLDGGMPSSEAVCGRGAPSVVTAARAPAEEAEEGDAPTQLAAAAGGVVPKEKAKTGRAKRCSSAPSQAGAGQAPPPQRSRSHKEGPAAPAQPAAGGGQKRQRRSKQEVATPVAAEVPRSKRQCRRRGAAAAPGQAAAAPAAGAEEEEEGRGAAKPSKPAAAAAPAAGEGASAELAQSTGAGVRFVKRTVAVKTRALGAAATAVTRGGAARAAGRRTGISSRVTKQVGLRLHLGARECCQHTSTGTCVHI